LTLFLPAECYFRNSCAQNVINVIYIFIGDDSLVVLIFIKGPSSDELGVHEQIQAIG